MSKELEEKVAELTREKRAVEEMLYQVLDAVGEPVEVPDEKIKKGIVGDKMIDVTHQADINAWVFRVVVIPSE